ncbi:MAG: hypothetical protein A2Z28_07520 [Chloroflexi bacterium RBG_16_51_9]|nr:MAG: hypothetical protein A2Z28_07520 [Chloroflexi bacterium RBG_16_51_9]
MVTMITAPAPQNGDNSNAQGHCSRCGKIWTLMQRQGVCRWCGKLSHCQTSTTKPRHVKSSSRRKPKQADSNGNGYHELPEPYLTFYNVALPFANSVPDREDLLHTIIANLADANRSNGHKPDNLSWMYRIASFTKAQYWREHYKRTNGLTCGNCSKAQRRKCKEDWLYGDCPKLVKVESLHKPIIDSQGNLTELGELIADDKALDIDAWLDARTFLLGAPERLLSIGEKLQDGEALTHGERTYLWKWRKQEQKNLV